MRRGIGREGETASPSGTCPGGSPNQVSWRQMGRNREQDSGNLDFRGRAAIVNNSVSGWLNRDE